MDPTPPTLPVNFPLPQLHAHLSQFIRPRLQASHIRQCVSAYFSDLVESLEHGGLNLHPPASVEQEAIDSAAAEFEKEIDGLLGRGTFLGPSLGGSISCSGGGSGGPQEPPHATASSATAGKPSGGSSTKFSAIPKWGGAGGGGSGGSKSVTGGGLIKVPQVFAPTEGRLGGERLRREYLIALRENILAKREYDAIATSIPSELGLTGVVEAGGEDEDNEDSWGHDDEKGGENENKDEDEYEEEEEEAEKESEDKHGLCPKVKDGSREFLDLYLSAHLLERQLAKLQILQHYIKEFPEPTTHDVPAGALPPPPPPPPAVVPVITRAGVPNSSAADEVSVDDNTKILLPLEKAIFRAYNELKEEKVQLEDVKKRLGGEEGLNNVGGSVDLDRKRIALEKTRAELIKWMEERLSHGSAGGNLEDAPEGGHTQGHSGGPSVGDEALSDDIHQKVVADIEEAYSKYLISREELISLFQQSIALSSPTTAGARTDTTQPSTTTTATTTQTSAHPPPNPSPLLLQTPTVTLLPLLTTHLPRLVHAQKSLLTTRTHISSTLATTKDNFYRSLLSLATHSPLLQPLAASNAIDVLDGHHSPVDIARAWEEVCKARRKSLEDDIAQRMDHSSDRLGRVETQIAGMQALLRLREDEPTGKLHGHAEDRSDGGLLTKVTTGTGGGPVRGLRAPRGAKAASRRVGAAAAEERGKKKSEEEKGGLWVGLDGGVGVIGDGI